MKEYKDIDRLFQEKFRDFEKNPSGKVWKNIENSISTTPKRDRRAIWLWFSGVAASLALLFFMNQPFTDTFTPQKDTTDTHKLNTSKDKSIEAEIVTTPIQDKTITRTDKPQLNTSIQKLPIVAIQKSNTTTKPKSSSQIANQNHNNSTLITPQNQKTPLTKQLINRNGTSSKNTNIALKESLIENNPEIAKNNLYSQEKGIQKLEQLDIITADAPQNEELAENMLDVEPEKSNKKWAISTLAAPVYISAFDKKTSSIDSKFDDNVKQGNFSAAYGVQVAYQLNNRFSLQSGVHVVDYGYKTYGVYVSPSGAMSRYSNINYDSGANLVNVSALPSVAQPNAFNETSIQQSKGDLTQVFGYIEIPIEAKYRLNKGNLGINVIGGFSTLLLNKNEIFIETADFSNKLGEASNLNSLNFSGNVGLELEYKLYKNVNFNLIPMFKVQTHTFENNTGGFSPYTIGVYSGLNLRF